MSIAIPPWRCSVLYQGKKVRQNAVAAAMSAKRPGKPGWYFRVLNWASEKGLSSLTWGRLRERIYQRARTRALEAVAPIYEAARERAIDAYVSAYANPSPGLYRDVAGYDRELVLKMALAERERCPE